MTYVGETKRQQYVLSLSLPPSLTLLLWHALLVALSTVLRPRCCAESIVCQSLSVSEDVTKSLVGFDEQCREAILSGFERRHWMPFQNWETRLTSFVVRAYWQTVTVSTTKQITGAHIFNLNISQNFMIGCAREHAISN